MSTDRQAQGFRAFLRVLRNRNFFWLWVSQLISFTGDFFSFLAVPYFITLLAQGGEAAAAVAGGEELPAEAKVLTGAAMIAATLPRLLGIFTGVFVDRWDYRRTMIVANTLAGLVVLLPLLVFSLDDAWLLIAMQFLLALVGRFIYPTQNAAVRQIFDDENDLLAANGLMMSSLTVGSIIGPLVAGVVVQQFGAKAAFLFDGASFVIAAAIIGLLLRLPRPTYRPTGEGVRVIAGQIWAGMRHIFVTRLLLATVICFALMQAGISGVNAMWVPYMRETFGLGPLAISLLDTVQGIGMAVGTLALGLMMARLSKYAIAALTLLGLGIGVGSYGVAPGYGVVLVASVLIGVLIVPNQSAMSTLMQLSIPREMQGRVMSSFHAITQAASVTAMSVITTLVMAIPLRLIYVAAGLVIVVMSGAWAWWARDAARALERRSAGETGEPLPAAVSD